MNLVLEKGHSRVPVYYEEPTNIIGLILVNTLSLLSYGRYKEFNDFPMIFLETSSGAVNFFYYYWLPLYTLFGHGVIGTFVACLSFVFVFLSFSVFRNKEGDFG